jgi:hypothetical protein
MTCPLNSELESRNSNATCVNYSPIAARAIRTYCPIRNTFSTTFRSRMTSLSSHPTRILDPSSSNVKLTYDVHTQTISPTLLCTIVSHQPKPLPPSNKPLMTSTASLPITSLDSVTTITFFSLAPLPLLTLSRIFIYL